MTTGYEHPQSTTALESSDPTNRGPVLVATDGTEGSSAPLRVAARLEQHTGAEVVVLSVLETLPLTGMDYGVVIPPIDSDDDARRSARMQRVRDLVTDVGERTHEWRIEVIDGDPPSVIARTARELKARVIVTGLGHHQLLDRLFGGEIGLHILRHARSPVLAVPLDFDELPERMVVATDFSPESVNAARVALRLFDTTISVHLVHVAPRLELQPDAFAAWMTVFREGIGPAFDRVRDDLALPAHVQCEVVTRSGKPSKSCSTSPRQRARM